MGGLFASCMRDNNGQPKTLSNKPKELSEAELNMAKLKNIRNDIFEKEKACDENVKNSENEIRTLMEKGKRSQAKYALQRKKLYEGYQDELSKKSAIIENTILEYQKTKMDKGMVDALQGAQKVIQDINKAIDLNVVADTIDDANQLSQKQKEMSEMLDQYNLGDVGDLDEELNKIQAENLKGDFDKVGKVDVKDVNVNLNSQGESQSKNVEPQVKNEKLDNQMEALLN